MLPGTCYGMCCTPLAQQPVPGLWVVTARHRGVGTKVLTVGLLGLGTTWPCKVWASSGVRITGPGVEAAWLEGTGCLMLHLSQGGRLQGYMTAHPAAQAACAEMRTHVHTCEGYVMHHAWLCSTPGCWSHGPDCRCLVGLNLDSPHSFWG